MKIIEVKNLSKFYKYYKKQPGLFGSFKSLFHREQMINQAVDDVSFQIKEGEFVGFIGPNGAGKTTTLKMLSGILYPSKGTAEVLGFTPWKRNNQYLKQISLIMGNKQQLWWDLPAYDSFLLNQKIYGIEDSRFKRNVQDLSKMLQIQNILQIQVRKLSLGQRMKAELALTLLHDPKVLFLDEPTIGLDVISQKNIREFLRKYNQEKKTTIILTSHYMDDIRELAKRVITIDRGQIIFDGNFNDLIRTYADEKVLKIHFKSVVLREEMEKYGSVEVFEGDYVEIIVLRSDAMIITRKILSEYPVDDLLVEEVEIEEVVRRIFERKKKLL